MQLKSIRLQCARCNFLLSPKTWHNIPEWRKHNNIATTTSNKWNKYLVIVVVLLLSRPIGSGCAFVCMCESANLLTMTGNYVHFIHGVCVCVRDECYVIGSRRPTTTIRYQFTTIFACELMRLETNRTSEREITRKRIMFFSICCIVYLCSNVVFTVLRLVFGVQCPVQPVFACHTEHQKYYYKINCRFSQLLMIPSPPSASPSPVSSFVPNRSRSHINILSRNPRIHQRTTDRTRPNRTCVSSLWVENKLIVLNWIFFVKETTGSIFALALWTILQHFVESDVCHRQRNAETRTGQIPNMLLDPHAQMTQTVVQYSLKLMTCVRWLLLLFWHSILGTIAQS